MFNWKRNEFLFLDGAMGTMLQQSGLTPGERPELFTLTNPDVITSIHRKFAQAGAQVLYTDTFGANAHKLTGLGVSPADVIHAAVRCARDADKHCAVALDIGPIGELLEPAGSLSFEEAYQLFYEQIKAGVSAGVDLIVIETMTDLYEVRAAVLAAKECCDLPIFVTMTFDENGRTFTGCSPAAMAITLEGLGVDAVGVNCSLGPAQLVPVVREIAQWTRLPLIVKANAGLPDPRTGEYAVGPEQFAQEEAELSQLGVSIFGGCCGTTPDFIAALRKELSGKTPFSRPYTPVPAACTMTKVVPIDGVRVIGERINPTGKKLFKQALLDGNIDYILSQGISQIEAGADILDVNVGLPGIDERDMMVRVVRRLQAVTDAPLQIDSSTPQVLEAALRIYNGKPIVNSVNGEQKTLDTLLPIIKKYGASVVGLTLDENGIPPTAEERFAIAERILNAALSYGLRREDVIIDCLTLTASAQQAEVSETLRALHMVKERLGLRTVLGVSNISFGLPNRELINQTFLSLALANGLDLPIINPNVSSMMDCIAAFNVLDNRDVGARRFIERCAAATPKTPVAETTEKKQDAGSSGDIDHAISHGLEAESRRLAQTLLETTDEMTLINEQLIPALDRVGKRFETGELFLPQLLQAAQAAQAAFDVVKAHIRASGQTAVGKGSIVMATVKGDIHDIGKNIVRVILENYGYRVTDLGRDVPIETVVEAARKYNAQLVGLSALMTTTLPSMEQTIAAVHEALPDCVVFVGGAVLTPEYAANIGADYYARDAKAAVDIAKKVIG